MEAEAGLGPRAPACLCLTPGLSLCGRGCLIFIPSINLLGASLCTGVSLLSPLLHILCHAWGRSSWAPRPPMLQCPGPISSSPWAGRRADSFPWQVQDLALTDILSWSLPLCLLVLILSFCLFLALGSTASFPYIPACLRNVPQVTSRAFASPFSSLVGISSQSTLSLYK